MIPYRSQKLKLRSIFPKDNPADSQSLWERAQVAWALREARDSGAYRKFRLASPYNLAALALDAKARELRGDMTTAPAMALETLAMVLREVAP